MDKTQGNPALRVYAVNITNTTTEKVQGNPAKRVYVVNTT